MTNEKDKINDGLHKKLKIEQHEHTKTDVDTSVLKE